MTKFTVKETSIEDLKLIYSDGDGAEGREWLSDLDSAEYASMGIDVKYVSQGVESLARGVLRGLHFTQRESPSKLITAPKGRLLVISIDMRPENRTFGAAYSVELNENNGSLLYVPPYFALGYMTLERDTEVVISYSTEYDPKKESGIVWDDDVLLIDWQFDRYEIDKKYLNISQRDKKWPSFRSYNPNLLWPDRPKPGKYSKRRNYKEERERRGYED